MFSTTSAFIIVAGIAIIWIWNKIGTKWMETIGVLFIIVAVVLLAFVHLAFTAFAGHTQVAVVTCHAPTSHQMLITLNGSTYELGGDRWMLQSSVVEVQPYLHFLGVSSGYSLDRLDSEFDDPSHKTAKPIILNGFSLYKSTNAWMYFPLIKSAYGNAVIQNCDNRTYKVSVDAAGDMSAERGEA